MQVDPIKSTLKAPGTKRLTLTYYEPLSNVAFKYNLCHYIGAAEKGIVHGLYALCMCGRAVQVTPIKPTLKAPGAKRLQL